MITFADFVSLAGPQDPARKATSTAAAFQSLSGVSALLVTMAATGSVHHRAVFTSGYTSDCVEHVCTTYVRTDPYYRSLQPGAAPAAQGWYDGFAQGFEARTWLVPAGYRNGLSMPLRDAGGHELGSVHMNTRDDRMSDRQLTALSALHDSLAASLREQLSVEQMRLTEREREVIHHLVAGSTNPEIAAALCVSRRTVATHIENILRKLAVGSRVEVAVTAVRLGLA